MKKIFTLLLTILSCASVNASNKNSIDFKEEIVEKQQYSFVINKESNQYKKEKFKSINDIDNEKKDKIHSLTIKNDSLFSLVDPENLPDILSVCCAFGNLTVLNLKDFSFEEEYIKPINRISSLKTIKVDILDFDLILKVLKTLDKVKNIFVLAENEGFYEHNVKDMPENFKTAINKLSVEIVDCTPSHNTLVKLGLPDLGKTSAYYTDLWVHSINSNLKTESFSFSKNGIVSKKNPFTRYLNINFNNQEEGILAHYYPEEGEINWFPLFFNQNENIPFQYNGEEGKFRVFTRKK